MASTPAFAETNPADPYEGYNRAVFKFNDKADQYVLAPVARGYRKKRLNRPHRREQLLQQPARCRQPARNVLRL